jgi:hypothetical protein
MAAVRRLRQAMLACGLPAVVAIAVLSPARADELTELRAGNLALQQKLAQARALNGSPASGAAADQGTFPGSFRIPGTQTSIRIGGNVTAIGHYTMER